MTQPFGGSGNRTRGLGRPLFHHSHRILRFLFQAQLPAAGLRQLRHVFSEIRIALENIIEGLFIQHVKIAVFLGPYSGRSRCAQEQRDLTEKLARGKGGVSNRTGFVSHLHQPSADEEHFITDFARGNDVVARGVDNGFEVHDDVADEMRIGIFEDGDFFDDIAVETEGNLGFQSRGEMTKDIGLLVAPAALPEIIEVVVNARLKVRWNIAVFQKCIDILHALPELTLSHIDIGNDIGNVADDETVDSGTHEHHHDNVDELKGIGGSDIAVADGGERRNGPVECFEINGTVR